MSKFCMYCGTELPNEANFCINCGTGFRKMPGTGKCMGSANEQIDSIAKKIEDSIECAGIYKSDTIYRNACEGKKERYYWIYRAKDDIFAGKTAADSFENIKDLYLKSKFTADYIIYEMDREAVCYGFLPKHMANDLEKMAENRGCLPSDCIKELMAEKSEASSLKDKSFNLEAFYRNFLKNETPANDSVSEYVSDGVSSYSTPLFSKIYYNDVCTYSCDIGRNVIAFGRYGSSQDVCRNNCQNKENDALYNVSNSLGNVFANREDFIFVTAFMRKNLLLERFMEAIPAECFEGLFTCLSIEAVDEITSVSDLYRERERKKAR